MSDEISLKDLAERLEGKCPPPISALNLDQAQTIEVIVKVDGVVIEHAHLEGSGSGFRFEEKRETSRVQVRIEYTR